MTITISSWNAITTDNYKASGIDVDLTDFSCWEYVKAYLEKKGFDLEGDDEELCIIDTTFGALFDEDIERFNVERVVKAIYDSKIMYEYYLERLTKAFCQAQNFEEWLERVEKYGEAWYDDMRLWPKDYEDFGREHFSDCEDSLPSHLECYFDYTRYAEDLLTNGQFYEVEDYIIEIW
jgi:hypothetical protein